MNQVRYTECEDIMRSAGDYPMELEHMNSRLRKKIRKRLARRCITGVGAFVGAVALFTAAVNTSTVIARTIERIPVIGDLAGYVKFDKGLQNAVKNQYTQEVNLEQEDNGYTLKMPYVIADSKRLVLFFQLPEIPDQRNFSFRDYQVVIDNDVLIELNMRSSYYKVFMDETGECPNGLVAFSIRSDEAEIPNDITIPVSLVKLIKVPIAYAEKAKEYGPMILGSYEFRLHLNDYKEPITTVLNQEVQVLDQTVVIQSITEYPTGVEIKATAPNNGTAVITDLEFIGTDEDGKEWSIPEETNPAITFHQDAVDLIYYLENDYFGGSPLAGLKITGAGMFVKTEQAVTIDLLKQTMTPAVADMYIKSIDRRGDTADITFESTAAGLSMIDISKTFKARYEDLQGEAYDMIGDQSASQLYGKTQYDITVIWPEDNQIVMERLFAPATKLEKPVSIPLTK